MDKTPFIKVYDSFLSKVTDDMYLELTELETFEMLQELLMSAIHLFEFPRFDINDYEETAIFDEDIYNGIESDCKTVRALLINGGHFNSILTKEEINILSTYMVAEWMTQQLASVENTRMKYSGSDFKFTSQANHLSKLLAAQKEYEKKGFHLQRLYKRRITENGIVKSTFGDIMSTSPKGRSGQ